MSSTYKPTDAKQWRLLSGEKRAWGDGMVELTFAVGRDETVSIITHESVAEAALEVIRQELEKP
jgi:hypothetical protein